MAERRLVLESTETEDGRRCIDIFQRPDGSFGFEEFIREPEENTGWQPVSHTAMMVFWSEEEVRRAAWLHAPWAGGN